MKQQKTNAMRILEQKKIPYSVHEYPHGDTPVDGVTVAHLTGTDEAAVFKTLVAVGASGQHYVFCVPVAKELDLKKAAKSVGEKSVALVHVREITPLTGYVRGGCSPVGMKKQFPTVFDRSVETLPAVCVSGGRIGTQIEAAPDALLPLVRAATADITVADG